MERFAAAFFGFTPREAELMDPQHRIFLELVVEALERAGYAGPAELVVGAYAGASENTYFLSNLLTNPGAFGAAAPGWWSCGALPMR